MPKLRANGIEREINLVVFDKDGLMFKSQEFWTEIGNNRITCLKKYLDEKAVCIWAEVFGLSLDDNGKVKHTDPKGILAVAAPEDEIRVTAGLIVQSLKTPWETALCYAQEVFKQADESLELKRALVPQKGFPLIFERLAKAGIKIAMATSDTKARAVESLKLFNVEPPEIIVVPEMVQHGKPAPDMLILASELCNVEIEKTAMVGDSYVDVKMAFEAGSFGIGVPETEAMKKEMQPYTKAIVNSLDDIIIVQNRKEL